MTIADLDTYLVGGAVRDQLLHLPIGECDWVVVGSTAEKMTNLGFRQVGKDFPVFLHPETNDEYALARTERKKDTGHKGFETHTESITLEQDLSRRDLTINAIAQRPDGDYVDPYSGQQDLHARVFRHVSAAFTEDPLRVLRVARFRAQLADFNFQIAPETHDLLTQMSASGELDSLTPERVWRETEKALISPRPRLYFETLRDIGALKVIFPEIDALFGIPQRPEFHPEIDAGLHTMLSLDRICEQTRDPQQRFAVLTHDLGKGTTPNHLLPRHPGHEARGAELASTLCKRLRIPNDYKNLAITVARHHLHCHRSLRSSPDQLVVLLENLGAWKENSTVEAFANCCMADVRGRTGLEKRLYPQQEFLSECARAAKNVEVMPIIAQGYKGADIGYQLSKARAKCLESVIEKYAHIDELSYARLKPE